MADTTKRFEVAGLPGVFVCRGGACSARDTGALRVYARSAALCAVADRRSVADYHVTEVL